LFPKNGIDTLREGALYPLPNVFVSVEDIIRDDDSGRVDGWLGFTYHNVEAMQAFYDILKRKTQRAVLHDIIMELNDAWSIEIQRKTKTDCPGNTPKYATFKAFKPSELVDENMELIKETIKDSNRTLLQYGDEYPETGNPVLWSVTIFTVIKKTNPSVFDGHMKDTFNAFLKLLDIR
jgi:hypothetical protein